MSDEHRSERFRVRASAPLRRETLIRPEPALGLVAMNGPGDPEPSLVIADGVVTELDGKPRERFDTLDRFIAAHGIDLAVAPEAMALEDAALARLLVDVDVPRAELVRLGRGLTPAKLARVVGLLDPVEMMFALKRLRARRAPANQAHVTNLKETRRCSPPTRPRRRCAASPSARRPWASPAMRRSTQWRCLSARRPAAPA